MPGDFFEQKIPNEQCPGCRKRDKLIKLQEEYIRRFDIILGSWECSYVELTILRREIEQLKNQL
jgi:hypothetical protein